VMILVFITAGVAIGMTQMNIFEQLNQLILETGVLVAVTMVLGWYESIYKEEHHKKSLVCNYKKEEIEELRKKIAVLNADNHEISEKTRDIRKSFV
ncbi:MAG: hypothetical protein LLG37_00485, partial [Spirochaetia bacterium]|nr:hypothetical protein [Spirochaetia bacterium]